ncbi:MAG: hypothetical protein E4H13_10705, partial [Calditrichales bacterium]
MINMKKINLISLVIIVLAGILSAQTTGVTVYGNYSVPIAGLSDWVKPAVAYGVGIGAKIDRDWYMEGLIEYTRYDQPDNSGYMAGKIDLSLEHIGLLYNARYWLTD